jgi:predicted DNA-binding transcriptional regulator AlpA
MTPPNNHQTTDFLLTAEDVAQILQISPRTVWRWRRAGRLPPPLRYSKSCVRWRASDIQQHLAGLRIAGTG